VRLVLYTGKGGVGKTTTAAATAVCAAERGLRTLVASADAAHSLGDVLERRLGPRPQAIAARLDAFEIDARVEMRRHWGRIRDYLVELFVHQGLDAVVAEELALLPGAEELTALLALEDLLESGAWDLVVLDCAPTDSTLRLVSLPDVARRSLRLLLPLLGAVAGVVSPIARRVVALPLPGAGVFRDAEVLIYQRLRALHRRLTGPETSVRLVATPERMVIDEARRLHTELSLFELRCDALVLNRLLPDAAHGEAFFRDWLSLQAERRREVGELFAPLPVLEAPLQPDEVTGLERLAAHGHALFAERAPGAVLCRAPRIRYRREGEETVAVIPLPGADPSSLGVVKIEDELAITSGLRRRSLKLPRRLAPLAVTRAALEGGALVVHFAHEGGSV
jgi:arsenite-transporting ATPase